jgi:uncharacterized membrane protein
MSSTFTFSLLVGFLPNKFNSAIVLYFNVFIVKPKVGDVDVAHLNSEAGADFLSQVARLRS